MAAGDSDVSICNLGLIALGQDPISALTDNRKAAILCNQRYDQVRREMLRAHPWGFARARAQLSAAAAAPAFGPSAAYTLPTDFIRLVDAPQVAAEKGWTIEGRQLLCCETGALNLLYIADCKDPSLFDPIFVAVLGLAVAVDLCVPITQDRGLKTQLAGDLEGKLSTARLVTSQDNSALRWDNDVLLEARH